MAKTKLFMNNNDMAKVIDGVIQNATIVAKTYGYSGHDVCIRLDGRNTITNDGVFVANHIYFEDELLDIGSALIRGITLNSDIASNDGTTASAILAKEIFLKLKPYLLQKRYKKKISNMLDVKNGMNKALEDIIAKLEKSKIKIKATDREKIYQVAFTATRDHNLSQILTQAFMQIGKDGRVLYKEKEGEGIEVKYKTGFNLEFGYFTPMLPNVLNNPLVFLYKERLNSANVLKQIIKIALENQATDVVLFIKDGVADLVAQQLIQLQQSTQVNLNFCLISIDENEKKANRLLKDLSVFTGASIMDNGNVSTLSYDNFGKAKTFSATDKTSTLVDGYKNETDFAELITDLNKALKNNRNQDDKESIKQRIANLNGKVAIIEIGGLSREKVSNYRDKIKDAVGSIKNAIDKGIVAGGGVALLNVYKYLHYNKEIGTFDIMNKDEKLGYNLVLNSLIAPINQILENSYANTKENQRILFDLENYSVGYNARTKKISKDMLEDGIIDPCLTIINSLRNAVELCSLFMNLEGFIDVKSEVLE